LFRFKICNDLERFRRIGRKIVVPKYWLHSEWGVGVEFVAQSGGSLIDFPPVYRLGVPLTDTLRLKLVRALNPSSIIVRCTLSPSPDERKLASDPVALFKALLREAGDQISYAWAKKQLSVLHSLWFGSSMLGDPRFIRWWDELLDRLKYEPDVEVPKSTAGDFYRLIPSGDPVCHQVFVSEHSQPLCLTPGSRQLLAEVDEFRLLNLQPVFPDEIENSALILCLEGRGGALSQITDLFLGADAVETRQATLSWRNALRILPNYPPDAAKALCAAGLELKLETLEDWKRGRVATAPSAFNIRGLHQFSRGTNAGFDLDRCLAACGRLKVAHDRASRLLRKFVLDSEGAHFYPGSRVSLLAPGGVLNGRILSVNHIVPHVYSDPDKTDIFP
jgi:hypothetical protein